MHLHRHDFPCGAAAAAAVTAAGTAAGTAAAAVTASAKTATTAAATAAATWSWSKFDSGLVAAVLGPQPLIVLELLVVGRLHQRQHEEGGRHDQIRAYLATCMHRGQWTAHLWTANFHLPAWTRS